MKRTVKMDRVEDVEFRSAKNKVVTQINCGNVSKLTPKSTLRLTLRE